MMNACKGFIAIYRGKVIEITIEDAPSLYAAKLVALERLKVPKSKSNLLAIEPAY